MVRSRGTKAAVCPLVKGSVVVIMVEDSRSESCCMRACERPVAEAERQAGEFPYRISISSQVKFLLSTQTKC